MSNLRKKAWLEAQSEKLVHKTFKNLEDNFKDIEDDYKDVYNELILNITKEIEKSIVNGEIVSPMLLQNKFAVMVQNTVNQLTSLDSTHDDYLRKLMQNYHTTITEYQIGLMKLAREDGLLFRKHELNETALNVALQIPYKDYDFVTGLNKGTFKVQDRLNKLLVNKIHTGESIAKLIPKIQEAFNVKQHIAERIARTETSRVLNTASLNTYKQAGIEKVKWLDSTEAIKGSKIKKAVVCGDCREVATHNDGIYYIYEVPALPLHPHCRCTVTPVIEELFDVSQLQPKEDTRDIKFIPREEKHTLSFKTLAEANKYLEENLGILSDVKRTAELEHITSFINITEELRKEFPELKDVVKGLKWESSSAIAYFQFGCINDKLQGKINLTPKYFKKGGEYSPKRVKTATGWHVKSIGDYNSAESTIYHEYGHAIHLLLGNKSANKNHGRGSTTLTQLGSDKELADSKRKALEKLGIEEGREAYRYFLNNVSKYGTTNDEELFAECFADVRINGELADDFSKLYVGDIERKLKEYENRNK